MCSKIAILFLGLLAMLLLIISSDVEARDLADQAFSNSKEAETNLLVGDAKYPIGGDYVGVGGYPYSGGGYFPGGGGGFGGGYFPGGRGGFGGGGGFRGGYPGQGGFPWQGGYGRGWYCPFGCCGDAINGGCRRCCHYVGERVAQQIKDKTTHN